MTAPFVSTHLTQRLAAFAVAQPAEPFPDSARAFAKLSMLDWAACGIAGQDEPVSRIVRQMVTSEGGKAEAFVFGTSDRLPARAAALANGVTSHALDYDDTHFDYIGHPSVAILPAVLALGERTRTSGAALGDAFLVGAEVACRIGSFFGRAHYQHGFHQTATAGTFGATAASARLLGLTEMQARHALGLAATRASGLKSQFGTMGKPYNAGIAAANGVETASLAALGFESRPDGIECEQGFAETHMAAGGDLDAILAGLGRTFRFEKIQFKYHACCHGTHAALEALGRIRAQHHPDPAAIRRVTLHVHPRWLRVCNIEQPVTALEAKFSYRLTAAMALSGVDTGALTSYTDAICTRPDLVVLRDKVQVETNGALADTEAKATLTLGDGMRHEARVDLDEAAPFTEQQAKVRAKAAALIGEANAVALWRVIENLEDTDAATFAEGLAAAQRRALSS